MSTTQNDSSGVIAEIQAKLKKSFNENIFSLWIEPLVWNLQGNALTLTAPDRFFKAHFERNFFEQVTSIIQGISSDTTIVLAEQRPTVPATSASKSTPVPIRLPGMKPLRKNQFFNPKQTFDYFVKGDCNKLACYACYRTATKNSTSSRVIWIDSSTGLGKSHLALAMCHELQNKKQQLVKYATAIQFCDEMVASLKTKTMSSFKHSYLRACDVLILEDIHKLIGKKKTIEEFSEIVETLIRNGKIVVTTSIMSKQDLESNGLDSHLLSILTSELVESIDIPTYKTKYGIIKQLVTHEGIILPDELIEPIINQPIVDIRKLGSIATTMCNHTKSQQLTTITDHIMEATLKKIIGTPQTLNSTMIKSIVATEFGISEADLKSRSRKRVIAFPRQMAMYLARKHTAESLDDIGSCFNRNHATVLHSVKVISSLLINNTSIQGQLEMLEKKLQTGGFIN